MSRSLTPGGGRGALVMVLDILTASCAPWPTPDRRSVAAQELHGQGTRLQQMRARLHRWPAHSRSAGASPAAGAAFELNPPKTHSLPGSDRKNVLIVRGLPEV